MNRHLFSSLVVISFAMPLWAQPVTAAPATRDVTLSVTAPSDAGTGTLIIGWLTAEEQAQRDAGTLPRGFLTTEIQRFVIAENAHVTGAPTKVTLNAVPAGALHVYAILDTTEQFWLSLWAGLGEGNRRATAVVPAKVSEASIALDKALDAPKNEERCKGERYRIISTPDVDPNTKTGERRLCAYVPKGYDEDSTRRFPVIYVLPGLFSSHTSKLVGKGGYAEIIDRENLDVILVGVDTRHTTGSVYFTDSARTGDFTAWMRDVVVPAVDTTLRTTKNPDERAVMGGSTGGFNALRLAQTLPEYFGAAAVLKPDGLDFETWLIGDDGKLRSLWRAWMRVEQAAGGPGQLATYAAHFSPNPAAPAGYDWPFDNDGTPNDAWAKWLAYSPINLLDAQTHSAAMFRQRYDGRLFIAVGQNDEFDLARPALRFADALDAQGMRYTLRVDEGGHFSHGPKRQAAGLKFLVAAMKRPRAGRGAVLSGPASAPAMTAPQTGLPPAYVQPRLPTAIQIDPGPPPLRWYGFFANVSAGTKNIGIGGTLRYLGLIQTKLSTDFLLTSVLNGLSLDDLDAFRLAGSQTIGFRIRPWPFSVDWRHVVGSRGPVPDIILGAGAWTVLEVDHAAQFFRQGDAGFFSGTAVGVFGSLAFRDVTMNLSWRPLGITMYWIDGRADSTPFAVGNPILDISLTYTLPI